MKIPTTKDDAANPDLIREHGSRGGFPVDAVSEVARTISAATGRPSE